MVINILLPYSTKYCYVYLLKSKDEAIEKFVLYKNEVENVTPQFQGVIFFFFSIHNKFDIKQSFYYKGI